MFEVSDLQKIGVGLVGFGMFFLFLGVVLMFDRALLAIGNLIFIAGLVLLIGYRRTYTFFVQRHKWKGSSAFLFGVFVVFYGWPLVGMCVEVYGFFMLFGGFFPVIINFIRGIPFLCWILYIPGISNAVTYLEGSKSMV